MVKTSGRVLTDDTCKLYAEQVIGCLQMWGMGLADAYYTIRHMKHKTQTMKVIDWKNPLEGTGLTAPQIIDEFALQKGLAPSVPANAVSATAMAALLALEERRK